jgi:predicted nuclease of predicted toxin-antitoxin system
MNFKIDENLPSEFVDLLTQAGFSADTVVQESLQGADDSAVADICQKETRILITLDLDFADIRSYPPNDYAGLVVLRPRRQDKVRLIKLLQSLIPMFSIEKVVHRLWIVDESSVRIRGEHVSSDND